MNTLAVRLQHQRGGITLDLAFSARPGITCIPGPSGAGKTSLLNSIAGLLRPDHARIVLGDHVFTDTAHNINLPPEKRQVGYVFQDAKLFPHMSVENNLRFGMKKKGIRYQEIVDLLELGPLTQRRPATLSGGEKKRVALARALLSNPRLFVMDEPLSGLDSRRRQEFYPYLAALPEKYNIPVLYVTHQLEEVLALADRLVVMARGQVLRQGTPEHVLNHPEIQEVFFGRSDEGYQPQTFLDARYGTVRDGLCEVETRWGRFVLPAGQEKAGQHTHLRIYAQDIALALEKPEGLSIQNALRGCIQAITPATGGLCNVSIRHPEDPDAPMLCAQITQRSRQKLRLEPGRPVWPLVKAAALAGPVHKNDLVRKPFGL